MEFVFDVVELCLHENGEGSGSVSYPTIRTVLRPEGCCADLPQSGHPANQEQ